MTEKLNIKIISGETISKEIQRWVPFHCTDMSEASDGKYVLYEDHIASVRKLEAKVERLREYREKGMPPDYEIDMRKLRDALARTKSALERRTSYMKAAEARVKELEAEVGRARGALDWLAANEEYGEAAQHGDEYGAGYCDAIDEAEDKLRNALATPTPREGE